MTLDNRAAVIVNLTAAAESLRIAADHATETEDGRSGLIGPLAMTIGGLSQAAQSIADLLEGGRVESYPTLNDVSEAV